MDFKNFLALNFCFKAFKISLFTKILIKFKINFKLTIKWTFKLTFTRKHLLHLVSEQIFAPAGYIGPEAKTRGGKI